MIYTNKQDKQQIKKAFNMLLVEFGTNLRKFCDAHGYSYSMTYQQLSGINHCSHDLINEMISKLDSKRSLQRINKKMMIIRN